MRAKKTLRSIKDVHVGTTNGNFIGIASAPEYIFSVNIGNNVNNGSYRGELRKENGDLIGSSVNLAPNLLRSISTNTRLDAFLGKKKFIIRATKRDLNKIETLNFGNTAGSSSWLTFLDTSDFPNLKTLIAFGSTSAERISSFDGSKNTLLSVLNLRSNRITSVNISNLINLTNLNLDDNLLTNVVLPQTDSLVNIYLYSNRITNIDLSYIFKAKILQIQNNLLTNLYLNGGEYTEVNASNNRLVSFDSFPSQNNCTNLQLHFNSLTTIPLVKFHYLKRLRCENNSINTLEVNYCNELEYLTCHINNISVLNITSLVNLTDLLCYRNPINVLHLSNKTKLVNLQFDRTNVEILDCPSTNLVTLSYYETKVTQHDWSLYSKLQTLRFSVYSNNDTFLGLENLTELRAFYIQGSNASAGNKINFDISYFSKINDIYITSGFPNVSYTERRNFTSFLQCIINPNQGHGLASDSEQVSNLIIDLSKTNWTGSSRTLDLRGNCATPYDNEEVNDAIDLLFSKGVNVLIN